jgi:hypothetical protein
VREAPTTEAANDTREALATLYMRLGRTSDMIRVLDEIRRRDPMSAMSLVGSSRSVVYRIRQYERVGPDRSSARSAHKA